MRLVPLILALALQLPADATAWICPMHPEVRTTEEGKCPRCGMALVTFRPDTSAPFLLDVSRKAADSEGTLQLDFLVRHPITHAPVSDLVTVHDRPAHLFVVTSDLRVFEHLHPEPKADGHLELTWKPQAPGRYHLFLDIVPAGALPQLLEAIVPVTRVKDAVSEPDDAGTVVVRNGVQALLEAGSVVAGEWARLSFKLTDVATGAEISGWETWLGAWAHLFAIRDGATDPRHAHPEEHDVVREGGLTSATFDVMFPRAGEYGVWVQIQRSGTVITLPFRVAVSPATAR